MEKVTMNRCAGAFGHPDKSPLPSAEKVGQSLNWPGKRVKKPSVSLFVLCALTITLWVRWAEGDNRVLRPLAEVGPSFKRLHLLSNNPTKYHPNQRAHEDCQDGERGCLPESPNTINHGNAGQGQGRSGQ